MNKKKLKIRKNKSLLFITMSLAVVSLMSVAFANYIIGLEKKDSNISLTISTSTKSYETLINDTKVSSINGSNTNTSSITIDKTKGSDNKGIAGNITFSSNIICSYDPNNNSEVKDLRPDKLKVSYEIIDSSSSNTTTTNNLNIITTSTDPTFNRVSNKEYSLFDIEVKVGESTLTDNTYTFNKANDFTKYSNPNITGSYYEFNKNISIELKWGSYFSFLDPDTFYNKYLENYKNEYLKGEHTKEELLIEIDKAYKELKSTLESIENKTFNFTFIAIKEESNSVP